MHLAKMTSNVVSVLVSLAVLSGCAKREQMMAASLETPAAQGTVSTDKGDNDNTVVHVSVKHLAPPFRVASDATTYVVWIRPAGSPAQAVGALKVDDDLTGTLDFVTPQRVFHLVVTPEAQASVAKPSHEPVFTADIDAR